MSYVHLDALVSTDWLAEHQNDPGVALIDASFTMPGVSPNAAQVYAERHIPGAAFFDIDLIADTSIDLPHMLPTVAQFEQQIGALGISNDSFVVIYDTPGLMSAGRLWWTLRVFGHDRVAILNGGLKKWMAEGRPVTGEVPVVTPQTFRAQLREELVRDRQALLANIATADEQVIDARAASRFSGAEAETRPGLRSGHIPASFNLPFNMLTNAETGELKPAADIAALLEAAGLKADKPVIATCGSGVTACALAFALHLTGRDDVAVYDGAWAEWGRPGDTPVVVD